MFTKRDVRTTNKTWWHIGRRRLTEWTSKVEINKYLINLTPFRYLLNRHRTKNFSPFPLSRVHFYYHPENRWLGIGVSWTSYWCYRQSKWQNIVTFSNVLSKICRSADKLHLNPPIVASTQPTVPSPPQQRTRKSGTLWKNFRLKHKTAIKQGWVKMAYWKEFITTEKKKEKKKSVTYPGVGPPSPRLKTCLGLSKYWNLCSNLFIEKKKKRAKKKNNLR